ncbi:hypothetical protein RP20_CCG014985 [Aedes albopictus]|nr:hypothetical protein RP20_CCG014985 [Aedes albopictus]
MDVSDDDPLSISAIALCAESRKLCIATNSGHVALFKFKRAESTGDIAVLEIPISYENAVDNDGSPECEFIPKTLPKQTDSVECDKKYNGMLKVKSGPQRKPPGFQAQLVCITPWTHGTHPGPVFRLKGSVLSMSLLDCNGALIPYAFESWKDDGKEGKEKQTPTKQTANKMSPTNPDSTLCDRQFIVIASEKQAGVFALPSQNCVYKKNIVETDFVVKAEIISMKDSVCLICYASNGHLLVFTLPSLKLLLDIDFLPLSELSFQTKCKQGIIDPMLSIWGQQLIVNEDTNLNQYNEMLGELYVAHEMPEAPKESFFKGLFGGGMRNLDREELFGESSGKANKSVAKHIPGPNANLQDLDRRATSASSEVSRAHQLMLERGDKLSQLEERTERMASEAQQFSSSAHLLMNKYKDKKWYQL